MKYDEVNFQVFQHSRQNDDVIMECLNLFALMLNSGEYSEWCELHETKMKLNQAFVEYETLLKSIHLNNEHNYRTKKIYSDLVDREKDN